MRYYVHDDTEIFLSHFSAAIIALTKINNFIISPSLPALYFQNMGQLTSLLAQEDDPCAFDSFKMA